MRRVAFLLAVLLVASAIPTMAADRHLILKPAQPLNEEQRASLADRGITVQKVLTGGRYLVVVEQQRGPRIAAQEELQSFGELQRVRPEWKIDRSVARAMSRSLHGAELTVLFHDDVTFDDARAAVSAAGGAMQDPLQVDFGVMRSLAVAIPADGVQPLAADDRVLAMAASERFEMVPDQGAFDEIASDNENSARTTKVAVVQAPPYNLSGEGVTLSVFELAKPDATHPEFQGRLTTNGATDGSSSDQSHATHVSGTMIAAGLGIGSKGMAPKAKLQSFVVASKAAQWLADKKNLPTFGALADNNSWGYVLGWKKDDNGNTIWNGYDDYYGAYDLFYTAPIDQIVREQKVLFVHSSGNDAAGTTFGGTWNQHKHVDSNGDAVLDKTYCYSKDGTGNDCPTVSGCTAGVSFCEVKKHMPDLPFWTVGVTASGKNTIAVGSVWNDKSIASSSSRGPARDGRVKPDLVAPGVNIYSTLPGGQYGSKSGTSMASPMVTGTTALLVEQWRKTFAGADPLPAEIKGLLIAGAEDVGNTGPDYTYGFGLIDAKASVDLILADGGSRRNIRRSTIATGQSYEMTLTQATAGRLKVVLQWTDPEIISIGGADVAEKALVNDLDLKVIGPNGAETLPYVLDKNNVNAPATRAVNSVDNTEVIEIANAAAGTYRAIVTGKSVTDKSPQEFVVITTAQAALPCTDALEKGDTADTAYGLAKDQTVAGAICGNSDVDYYSLRVNNGLITINVTTNGTPVRVSLLSGPNGPSVATADVAANSTGTLSYNWQSPLLSSPPPDAIFIIKVERQGELAATSGYTLTPSFKNVTPSKRRATGR